MDLQGCGAGAAEQHLALGSGGVADGFFGGRERIRRLDRHMLRAGLDQRQELPDLE